MLGAERREDDHVMDPNLQPIQEGEIGKIFRAQWL